MALDFYDYRPASIESAKTAEKSLGTTKVRFPELVLQAPRGALPSAILCAESVKVYEDGEQVATRLPNVLVQMSPEMLAEKFTLYNPLDGKIIGELDYGSFIGIVYSFERAILERDEAEKVKAAEPVEEPVTP